MATVNNVTAFCTNNFTIVMFLKNNVPAFGAMNSNIARFHDLHHLLYFHQGTKKRPFIISNEGTFLNAVPP